MVWMELVTLITKYYSQQMTTAKQGKFELFIEQQIYIQISKGPLVKYRLESRISQGRAAMH